MSVSSEWNALKAAWILLLIALVARIFFSGQFLLTPEEALYWHSTQNASVSNPSHSPVLSWLIQFSTSLFGKNEIAVRLPAILAITLASFFMALLAASMFSWHTALHITLLSQGILHLNMAALIIGPYSLLLPCWAAVCYYGSQAMHSNRTVEWLLGGFWFGLGLLCSYSMVLLLPCIALSLLLIKPFRTCLFYPGPWLSLLLSLCIYLGVDYFWHDDLNFQSLINRITDTDNLTRHLVPDFTYSLQFVIDQTILLTPIVFLLILVSWMTGSSNRHLVKPDAQFLALTSLPLFLVFLLFPLFNDTGTSWPISAFITALIFIAGLHSSTRSNFKGRPKRRWILAIVTAYLVTVPLLLQMAYPVITLPLKIKQTQLKTSGWDILGQEMEKSILQMPDQANTFIFSMDSGITSELAFYTTGDIKAVSLDHMAPTNRKKFLENEMQLTGRDGLGLVDTKAAMEKLKQFFDDVELERKITLRSSVPAVTDQAQTFFIVRCFNFKKTPS